MRSCSSAHQQSRASTASAAKVASPNFPKRELSSLVGPSPSQPSTPKESSQPPLPKNPRLRGLLRLWQTHLQRVKGKARAVRAHNDISHPTSQAFASQ